MADSPWSDSDPQREAPNATGGKASVPPAPAPLPDAGPARRPAGFSPRVSAPPRAEAPATWFLSESSRELERIRRPLLPTERRSDAAAATGGEGAERRAAPVARLDLSRISRWALPILALVAGVETGWLLTGFFRTPSVIPVAPVAPVGTSATLERPSPRIGLAAEPLRSAPAIGVSAPPPALTASTSNSSSPTTIAPTAGSGARREGRTDDVSRPQPVQSGYLSIPMPFQVQVYEGGRFIGLNGGDLPLSGGIHQLQLVNDSVGFRATERVTISAGKTTRLALAVPTAPVQLNAVPWAEVTIDGTSVGDTPLGNVPLTLGAHTIVFRHPQLGEETRSVVVTAQSPTRVSVDLRK